MKIVLSIFGLFVCGASVLTAIGCAKAAGRSSRFEESEEYQNFFRRDTNVKDESET